MDSKLISNEKTSTDQIFMNIESNEKENKVETPYSNNQTKLFNLNNKLNFFENSSQDSILNPFANNICKNGEFNQTFSNNNFSNESSTLSNNPFTNSTYLFKNENSFNMKIFQDNVKTSLENNVKSQNSNSTTNENVTNENQKSNLNICSDLQANNYATIAIQETHISKFQNDSNLENKVSSNFNNIQKTINEKQLLLASCLLNNACEGLPSDHNFDPKSLYLYSICNHFILHYLHYFLIILHHSLAFFEQLGLSREYSKYDNITITLEIIFLAYYSIRLILKAYVQPAYKFYSDMKNLLIIFAIFFTLIDIITYLTIPQKYAYRWSILLRPLFFINFTENRQIKRLIRNIRSTLPEAINVLSLLFISIAFFSLVAVKLFKNIRLMSPNEIKIKNYLDMYYQLFIFVTRANNLDLKMPAYNENKWFAVFFILFWIVNIYILMNIILAVLYNNFKKNMDNEINNVVKMQKSSLAKSFEVIVRRDLNISRDTDPVFNENESINSDQFKLLIQTYFTCWKLPSTFKLGKEPISNFNYLIQVYWKLLELNSKITWKEYQHVCDLLLMDIKIIDLSKIKNKQNNFKFFKFYQSILSQKLIKLTKTRYFRYFFDGLILLNSILIVLEIKYIKQLEWTIILVFVFEILIKVYTFGLNNYLIKFWNVFDFVIIGTVICILSYIEFSERNEYLTKCMDILMIIRVLRLCKLLKQIRKFDLIRKTILKILPYLFIYGTFLFLIFYVYSVIGMQFFRNIITNEIITNDCKLIKNTVYRNKKEYSPYMIKKPFKMEYCELNFNTFSNSLMLLFDMMGVNQWHIFSDNYELVTGSKLTRIYFASFYLICVILLLNIFTSFVLEIFIIQHLNTKENNLNQNELQTKIKQLSLASPELNFEKKSSETNTKNKNESYLVINNECDNEILDADHDFYEYNIYDSKNLSKHVNNNEIKNSFLISLSPDSSFRILIKENCTIEQLFLKRCEKKKS